MNPRLETKRVFIHSTASSNPNQDSIEAVTHLHTAKRSEKIEWGRYSTRGREFSECGYHFLVTKNPCRIVLGRDLMFQGAGVRGHNEDSIHIAMSGDNDFTDEQYKELRICLDSIYMVYPQLNDCCVFGHREVDASKSCPQFSVNLFLMNY